LTLWGTAINLFSDTFPTLPPRIIQPRTLNHASWPPDYTTVYAWRQRQLIKLRNDPDLLASAKAHYAKPENHAQFIVHWMDTYDPRKSGTKWMPFIFFERQEEYVRCLNQCIEDREGMLTEKCRDGGITWVSCGISITRWLFVKNESIGWGSRKADLVDRIGDPDSIFEKMRLILRRLPEIWLPKGFKPKIHATSMMLINPENGAVVSGDSGDEIGRGGRSAIYFIDESAHIPRPQKIQAALDDNTNVQIHISSVNGLGNVFHRKRQAGIEWSPDFNREPGRTRVFVFDWRHHPDKTQAWYDQRRANAEREGMLHIFAQEVDRDYSAAISNTTIPREWVQAAVDAHLTWKDYKPTNNWMAGLDVADGGVDRNGFALRQDVVLRHTDEWAERDGGATTRRTVQLLANYGEITVQYDCIGVGATVKAEYNRLMDGDKPPKASFMPWNAGAKVVDPYYTVIPNDDKSPMNDDFFDNMKAQAWWSLRNKFYKTWRMSKGDAPYPHDELISLDSRMPLLHQVIDEIAQPTTGHNIKNLKMIINKKPEGMKSPNIADAIVQCYFPAPDDDGYTKVGTFGG
jgi:phage terminase large subunit